MNNLYRRITSRISEFHILQDYVSNRYMSTTIHDKFKSDCRRFSEALLTILNSLKSATNNINPLSVLMFCISFTDEKTQKRKVELLLANELNLHSVSYVPLKQLNVN